MAQVPSPARRILDRVAFGPRPGLEAELAARGPEAWLRAQLARPAPPAEPPLAVPDGLSLREMRQLRRSRDEQAVRERVRMLRQLGAELAGERLVRVVDGEHPLHEAMVDFWANHFSVFARKGPEPRLLPDFEARVLRPHALGRFDALLLEVARHPAMLFYLDNWRSASAPGQTRELRPGGGLRGRLARRFRPQGPNENYARELLELHTLGVDGGYDQADVEAVARALTGWTLRRDGDGHPEFRFEPAWHDRGPKQILGRSFQDEGVEEGEAVLRLLAHHPSTARFLARKLAVRFVADHPPEAVVARTARAFSRSGGDLRRTLEALLLGGDELLEARLVKVKTPFELVASAIRATGAELRHPLGSLRVLRELGQLPYLAPTPEGYPDVATRWIDPGSVLARTRFAFALAGEQIPGLRLDEVSTPDPRSLPAGPLGASTRRALAEPGLAGRERLAVALASPEFQLR